MPALKARSILLALLFAAAPATAEISVHPRKLGVIGGYWAIFFDADRRPTDGPVFIPVLTCSYENGVGVSVLVPKEGITDTAGLPFALQAEGLSIDADIEHGTTRSLAFDVKLREWNDNFDALSTSPEDATVFLDTFRDAVASGKMIYRFQIDNREGQSSESISVALRPDGSSLQPFGSREAITEVLNVACTEFR